MSHRTKLLVSSFALPLLAVALRAAPASAASETETFDEQMQPILKSYLAIQVALAGDSTKGVSANAKAVARASKKLTPKIATGDHAAHYADLPKKLETAATALAKAHNIEEARTAFKELSKPMAMWGTMSKPTGISLLYCPMAKASWLQKGKEIRNPYHGASMLRCGQIVGGDGYEPTAPKHHHH
jgi:Cu(I)/Ag(I) efflux system membrane fusion protein